MQACCCWQVLDQKHGDERAATRQHACQLHQQLAAHTTHSAACSALLQQPQ
jgi:hypothetical protein